MLETRPLLGNAPAYLVGMPAAAIATATIRNPPPAVAMAPQHCPALGSRMDSLNIDSPPAILPDRCSAAKVHALPSDWRGRSQALSREPEERAHAGVDPTCGLYEASPYEPQHARLLIVD